MKLALIVVLFCGFSVFRAEGKAAANPPVEIEPPHYGRTGRLPPGSEPPRYGRVAITPRDVLREPRELVQEEDEGERIVGGTDATPGEFPYIISLQAWTSHFCGGSIYDEQTVVTAAHCIDGQSQNVLDNMYVVAGEQELHLDEGSEQRIKVVNIVTINYSSRTMDNDIAILHLESPFVFNQRVQPISPCSSEYSGAVTVAGWGALEEGGQGPRTLQKVELQTVSDTTCNWSYGSITDNMVCAGVDAGGKDSCQGDSGGPLVTGQGTDGTCLLGVVSFGYGCARQGYPGVYAKVSQYVSWLSQNAAGAGGSASAITTPTTTSPAASDGKCMGTDGGQCQFWSGWSSDCSFWKDSGAYWCLTVDYRWDQCDQYDVDCPF